MEPIRWVIDRIEDRTWAVLVREPNEGDSAATESKSVSLDTLPAGVREGDVLRELAPESREPDASVFFELDPAGKALRQERLETLRQSLRRGPSGSFRI